MARISGCEGCGSGIGDYGLWQGFRSATLEGGGSRAVVEVAGFRVQGVGSRVQGAGFRV